MSSKKQNLKDVAYCEIKHRIIDCIFEPNTLLNEEMLQNDLGISRTPIREALIKLEHERLVHIMPKKGIRVSGFTLSDMYQVYEVRLLTEPYVIRNYGKSIENEALHVMKHKHLALLASMKQGYTGDMQIELYKLDDEFHDLLFAACPNPHLRGIFISLKAHIQRMRIMLGKLVDPRVISTVEEHLSIIQELLDEEFEEAANTMTQHLIKSQKTSLSTIMSNPLLTRF